MIIILPIRPDPNSRLIFWSTVSELEKSIDQEHIDDLDMEGTENDSALYLYFFELHKADTEHLPGVDGKESQSTEIPDDSTHALHSMSSYS